MQKINDFVQRVAVAIADTTMCNVTITDRLQVRIAGTGPYEKRIGEKVPLGSAFYEARAHKKTIVVETPTADEICSNCKGRENCIEEYEICTPILKGERVMGIIGIFANDTAQKQYIKSRRDAFQSYVENMSKLLSSYILAEELLFENRMKKYELETILESTDYAVFCLDHNGVIRHLNSKTKKLFKLNCEESTCIGVFVEEAFGKCDLFRRAVFSKEELVDVVDVVETLKGELITISATVNRIIENMETAILVITAMDAKALQKTAFRQRESVMDTSFDTLIGQSELMRKVIGKAQIAAAYDSTILITGESGTGKELFARAIHRESPRLGAPFISINCSAIPESLLESELFGYEAGAFTGASVKGKMGKMELANNGTLFLDEIGDMPLFLQAKLLRVLQDRRIMKIGGTEYIDLDVRIIAATNQDLEALIVKQEFREDLYYRLNVIPLALPSLRERRSDIPEIAEYFLTFFKEKFAKKNLQFSDEAITVLKRHDWKGNVRELQNVIEYLVSFSDGPVIEAQEVISRIAKVRKKMTSLEDQVKQYEKQIIEDLLAVYGDDATGKARVATELGISMATLYRKIAH